MSQRLACLSAILLSSCAMMLDPINNNLPNSKTIDPSIDNLYTDLAEVKLPLRKPVIAIYLNSFTDQTGQRRSNSDFATFSTAITQAPHAYLIRALKHSEFFEVVERVSFDSVTKERQIIRSTRENFDEEQKLLPLKFADLLMTGGVISYQANIASGGAGARYLGIGSSKSYRTDSLTVSLRTVSISTGEVLTEVTVTKKILSAALDNDVFRFVTDSTKLIEIEGGIVKNEPINIALQIAIETAVLETINQGALKKYWSFK